jgi:hypothetical protein
MTPPITASEITVASSGTPMPRDHDLAFTNCLTVFIFMLPNCGGSAAFPLSENIPHKDFGQLKRQGLRSVKHCL